ncbi:MAG: hypothetical protein RIQ81_1181 [Pseudomonadota bacterium]
MALNTQSKSLTLLRRKDVESRTGLRRSTIYERMKNGTFPRPIKLGARVSCWPEHEIETWLDEQIAVSRGEFK